MTPLPTDSNPKPELCWQRTYTRRMEQPVRVDITGYSFDEFVAFLFAREWPAENRGSEKREYWYCNLELTFDAEQVSRYYTHLFLQPEFLLNRFSKIQLEEGFWAIASANLECSAYRIIEDTSLPLAIRGDCIRSMYELFRRLFATEPLDSSVFMWWDSLCYDWHCGNRDRESGGEDLELQDVFFETLERILFLDSETCQRAALHGLGHLHHPGTAELIDRFMRERPSLTKGLKEYAVAAAKFEVQ
jgi:hypothetical protein